MRPFNWNRVILDFEGKFGTPGAVLKRDLKAYDPAWIGITVVWNEIYEVPVTSTDEIIDMFGVGGSKMTTKKGGVEKRKWFVDKTRNSIEILKKKID